MNNLAVLALCLIVTDMDILRQHSTV